eukprot:1677176-Amphidinium_carterae.1
MRSKPREARAKALGVVVEHLVEEGRTTLRPGLPATCARKWDITLAIAGTETREAKEHNKTKEKARTKARDRNRVHRAKEKEETQKTSQRTSVGDVVERDRAKDCRAPLSAVDAAAANATEGQAVSGLYIA